MPSKIIAHRGARSLRPENTLCAIQKAWDLCADGVELDITLSADQIPVIIHDDTLERTTDVRRKFPDRTEEPVNTFTLAELRQLDAGSWFLDTDPFGQLKQGLVSKADEAIIRQATIPTLAEVLNLMAPMEWIINLELKSASSAQENLLLVTKSLEVIDRCGGRQDRLVLSSFNHGILDQVAALAPAIRLQALIGDDCDGRNIWGDYRFATFNANQEHIDQEQVQQALKKGCTVNLYTCNDLAAMYRYQRWGVDNLITDFPQYRSQVLARDGS